MLYLSIVNASVIAITPCVRDSAVPILCLLSLPILNGSIVRPALVSLHISSYSICFPLPPPSLSSNHSHPPLHRIFKHIQLAERIPLARLYGFITSAYL